MHTWESLFPLSSIVIVVKEPFLAAIKQKLALGVA